MAIIKRIEDSVLSVDPMVDAMTRLLCEGYGLMPCQRVCACSIGLINSTYDVDSIWIVQRVNPIFGANVNDDIAFLTPILRSRGVNVPVLCRALNGANCVEGACYGLPDGIYRVMTKLEGKTRCFAENIEQVQSLSRSLARFHRALGDVSYVFSHTRPQVHDFYRHRAGLEQALQTHRKHPQYVRMKRLAERMKNMERGIPKDSILSCEVRRIIHGDPKISNFMFQNDEVTGVVDLDTMASSLVSFDVGDAIRSWCNPRTESDEPEFNLEYAREILGEYEENSANLTREERALLKPSAPYIVLELAMRFARDALCEDYFGFDPKVGHAEHSARRAEAMAALCDQMLASNFV